MTVCLPLTKSLHKLLPKSVLLPSGLSGAMSATDAATQKKTYGPDTLIFNILIYNNFK